MVNKKNGYAGIDYFRMPAALLVIAIHTSPLAVISETGDFILTRAAARTAVPFFFMTSGFFLITRYTKDETKLAAFIKKILLIYGAAVLLYLPVNIYNGYFQQEYLLPNLIKDLVCDGTLYHLWYLPASVTGAAFAWVLVKKCGYFTAFTVTVLLYITGLFGDSYYGISAGLPAVKKFYGLLFQISDYTRNGVFFAPVFFVLGGFLADSGYRHTLKTSLSGFAASFMLMLMEALTLHHFRMQRHDSMYLFLLPCMNFLFQVLLHFRGKRLKRMGTLSLVIYIIHPMMIIVVRMIAGLLHVKSLLVDNSLLHYVVVCLLSVWFSLVANLLWEKYSPKKKKHNKNTERTWIEINLENLEHNAEVLKAAMPADCELMAVVKAHAYGHGDFETAACLEKTGVRAFAVATINEGIRLRKYGIRGEILVLGYTDVCRAGELKKYGLIQTLVDFSYASALNEQGVTVWAHIKIDTGMHRLGMPWEKPSDVKLVFAMKNIRVLGIYTHLCCSDSREPEDVSFTEIQLKRFFGLTDALGKTFLKDVKLHVQSSYGILNYPEIHCHYVRAGIALYGVSSLPDHKTKLSLDLRPVLSLKSRVVLVRDVKKGESVGYGRKFKAERDSRIAILPAGYADGVPGSLSGPNGSVLIGGKQVPVIGRICMDQLAVDITDTEAEVGDEAVLVCAGNNNILSASSVAENSGSISNELLSRLGERLPVVVK